MLNWGYFLLVLYSPRCHNNGYWRIVRFFGVAVYFATFLRLFLEGQHRECSPGGRAVRGRSGLFLRVVGVSGSVGVCG